MLGQGCSVLNATSWKSFYLPAITEHLQRAVLWECRVGFFKKVSPPPSSKIALIGAGRTMTKRQLLPIQQAPYTDRGKAPRKRDERALDSDRDSGKAARRRGDAKRCAFLRLPGAHLRGWLFKKKSVLKNYDAPACSPTQRRKSRLYALSFPPLGTF